MAEVTFYRCNKCGNLVMVLDEGSCVPQCCGEPMQKLVAGATDAATEKHVPAVSETEDGKLLVTVGSVEHPMTPEHYIEWIAYADEKKTIVKHLKPGDKPQAKFCHKGEGATVYAYCNLHGLWKTEL